MIMLEVYSDEFFMKKALEQAENAYHLGEIPVGAVIVSQQHIIARGHNTSEQLQDVTAHAEIIAITAASNFLNNKYLKDCTLYVTLEPCVMCAGALFWSQIGKVIYGASDEKRGFMRYGKSLLHPKTELAAGIMELDCSELLQQFFKERRS